MRNRILEGSAGFDNFKYTCRKMRNDLQHRIYFPWPVREKKNSTPLFACCTSSNFLAHLYTRAELPHGPEEEWGPGFKREINDDLHFSWNATPRLVLQTRILSTNTKGWLCALWNISPNSFMSFANSDSKIISHSTKALSRPVLKEFKTCWRKEILLFASSSTLIFFSSVFVCQANVYRKRTYPVRSMRCFA